MTDLRDLYQQVILDHYKNPRNQKRIDPYTHFAKGHNPLCGDRLNLFLNLLGNTITEISFEGTGCAISQASASMMTEAIKGKSIQTIEELFEKFHTLVTSEHASSEGLGKLAVFSGVREFPARVKCASLAWHTLKSALEKKSEAATTESAGQ